MRAVFQAGGWHIKGNWGAGVAGAPWETGRVRDGDREVAGALQYMAKSQDFILFVEEPLQVVPKYKTEEFPWLLCESDHKVTSRGKKIPKSQQDVVVVVVVMAWAQTSVWGGRWGVLGSGIDAKGSNLRC